MGEPMESDEDGGSDLGEVEFQEDSPVNPEVVELLSSDDENGGKAAKKEVKAKNDVTTDVMEGENDITTEVVDLDAEDEKSSKAPKEKAGSSKEKEKEKKKKKRQKPDVPSDESYYDSLPPKEMKYLKKNLLSEAELSQSSIVCTACYKQVNYKQEGAMMRHADLAVPVCKRCRKFYHNGEWRKDEEGYYEYCSWCAQGGDLLCCDSCPNAFCKKCIKRNLGRSKVSEIEELDKWDCLVCEPVQVYKQRAQYYSIWTYSVKEAETEEQIKEKKEVRKNVKFVDEAHKDGMEVNKIFGNYLQKSMKSWASKCDEKVEKDDATKLVTKFRTIIKIAHHNLDLLDKQLLEGCMKSFPDVTEEELGARDMPAEKDVAEPESVKAKTNKSPKKKVKTEKPVKEEKNAKNGSNAKTAASEVNGEALAGAELELTSEEEDGDSDKKKGGLRVKSLSALLPKGMNKTSTPKKPGPASQTRKQGEKTPKKDVKGQKNGKECNGDASKDMFDDSEDEKADPKVELVLPELDEANKAARAALLNSSSDENSDKEDTKSVDSKVQSSEKEKANDKKLDDAKSKSKKTEDTKSKDKNSDEDKSKDKKSDDTKSKNKKSDEEEANNAARTALLNSSSDENADKEDSPADNKSDDSKVQSSDKEKSKDKKSDDAKSKNKKSDDTKSKDKNSDKDKSKDKKSESKSKKSDEDDSEDKKSEDDEQAGDTKKTKEKKSVDAKPKDKKSLEEKSKDKKPVEEKSKDKKSVEEKSKDKKSASEKSKDKKEQKGKGNTSEDDVSKNKTSEDEKTTKADSDDEFEQMANQNSDDDKSSKSKKSDDGDSTKENNADKEQSDVKDEEQSDVKEEVHPSLKPKKEKSDEEDGDTTDKKDKTQKKKLKTKKELDEIKRRSVEKTADDESGSQDESKSVKEEDGSSDKPEKKKKEKKAAKSNGTVFSNSSEDSGEDRLGIGELSPEKKLTKKQEQQLKEKEEKKEKEKEIKKKEREEKKKAEKKEKEEKKKEKRANKASDNDSDDDQLVKAVKKAKKMREKKIEKLRLKAAEIDPKIAQLSDMTVKIDVVSINEEIKKDLKENECVDVDTYPDLYTANDADDNIDDEIDKLCNFETLKGRARDRDSDGDKKDKDTKKKTNAKKKEKEAGMEDMSSGSEEVHSDEESDEEQKKTEEKSRLDLAAKFLSRKSVSSSSEGEEHSDDSTEGKEKDGKKSEKKKGEKKRKGHSSDSSDKEKKPKAKQSKLLSMKLSESESSDDDEKKYREKIERKKAEQAKKKAEKGSGDSSDSDIMTNAAKKGSAKHKLSASGKKRKRALAGSDEEENGVNSSAVEEEEEENSDSDSSDSDGAPKKKGKKKGKGKKKKTSSSEEDSDVGERPKKKRKRIKKKGSDDSDDDDDEEEEEKSPTKRVDIKKVIKDKNLEEETKEAAVVEKERRKRIEERQEKYNDLLGKADKVKEGAVVEEMILDFDEKTKETLVEVDKRLVKKLKPHQVGGIRFMWDTTFESLAQIKAGKMPGGAILAHCMGLGKTLQSVTLIHTVLANKEVDVERVMVLCPVNVVKNWAEEFDKWLIGSLEVDVFEMSGQKDNWGRADVLNSWYKEGGVLICGYDMFRNLTNPKNAKYKKKQKETFARCLLDPGADLIICDEGHLLKNEKSAINAAVNRIKSPRRIVLSGTPLQNNLKEYYEMVNFVKPQLMGTRKEFMNRFVNPIVNGQHSDSTERDVKMMKKRSYLLNDLLKGCMQRLDYNVLVPYLMPKQEYVLTIELTPFQKTLYKYYLANYAKAGQIGIDGKLEGGKKGGLFYDVQNLSRVWNHPYILLLSKMRKDMTNENDESGEEGSLKDFVCDDTEESESDTSSDDFSSSGSDSSDTAAAKKKKKKAKPASKRATRADKPEELVTLDDKEVVAKMSGTNAWWNQFLEEDQDLDDIMLGSKMVLLMDILKECAMMGDKVLVFSQSILSLDLIEDFLAKIHDNHEKSKKKDGVNNIDDSLETWVPGKDYYRMDGSTAADTRKVWCKYFNQATSHRMRLFLISTKAGGLGINLVAANRVIIFDASWNPSHDVQSIFRVFRFGQTKPVYIYRFLAKGTMEEKIYDRQVTKQSMSARVVDEHQIDSHFTMNDLVELYEFKDEPESARPIPMVPEDRLLAELVDKHKALVWNIHNHDSLLENKVEENLSEEERKRAWEEFENEKKGYVQQAAGNMQQQGVQHVQQMLQQQQQSINPMAIQAQLRQMYPQLSHEELMAKTRLVIMQYQQSIMEQSIMQQRQMQQQKLQQQQMQMQQQQQMQQQLAAARASAQRTIANRERTHGPSKDVINLDDD